MTNKEFVPFSEEDFSAALDAAKCAGVLDSKKGLAFVVDLGQQRLLRDNEDHPGKRCGLYIYIYIYIYYSSSNSVPDGIIDIRGCEDETIFRWVRPSESEPVVELPGYFNPHTARRLLENPEPFLVEDLCIWNDSIQQYDFWLAEYERVSLGKPLSHNAVMVIEGWLEVWESQNPNGDNYKFKENTMSLPDRFNLEYARESLESPTYESIDRMCAWNDTPQKFWFWWNEAAKAKGRRPLSEEARMTIRGWLEVWEEQNTIRNPGGPPVKTDGKATVDFDPALGVNKCVGVPILNVDVGLDNLAELNGIRRTESAEPTVEKTLQIETTYTAKFIFRGEDRDGDLPTVKESLQIPDPLESEGWEKGEKVVCNWPPKHVRDTGYGGFILDGDCKDFPINHENGLLWWGDYYERFDDEIPTADALCISYTEWAREVPPETKEKPEQESVGPTWWPDGNHVGGPVKKDDE